MPNITHFKSPTGEELPIADLTARAEIGTLQQRADDTDHAVNDLDTAVKELQDTTIHVYDSLDDVPADLPDGSLVAVPSVSGKPIKNGTFLMNLGGDTFGTILQLFQSSGGSAVVNITDSLTGLTPYDIETVKIVAIIPTLDNFGEYYVSCTKLIHHNYLEGLCFRHTTFIEDMGDGTSVFASIDCEIKRYDLNAWYLFVKVDSKTMTVPT